MAFTIYMVTAPDGRSYVGCTSKRLSHRWTMHCCKAAGIRWKEGAPPCLLTAIARYGRDAFTLKTLAVADDVHDAAAIETLMIERHGTMVPGGYNRRVASGYPRFKDAA